MNKITCICLGVKSMEKAIKFYRDGLGYKTDCKENKEEVKLQNRHTESYTTHNICPFSLVIRHDCRFPQFFPGP